MTATATAESPAAELELRRELTERIERCSLELPTLPQVAGEILAMTADPNSDAAALSALAHRDQALAGHILHMANSAAFGGASRILSLQHAIARLGVDLLAEIALSISLSSRIFGVPGYQTETRLMWRHSLTSGLYAKEIARHRRKNVETAFLCGLLHQIGRPVVLKAALEITHVRKLKVERAAILALVDELHSRAGALLAVRWALPRPVLESIIYAASGRGQPQCPDEARTTLLASRLATWLLIPGSFNDQTVRDHEVFAELNLYPEEAQGLLGQAAQVMLALEAMAP